MITAPSIWGMMADEVNNGVFRLVGSGAPTSGAAGTGATFAGKASTYMDIATGFSYKNTNTAASPTWTLVGIDGVTGDVTFAAGVSAIGANKVLSTMMATNTLQRASGTISSANLTGTSAGQFGHANGVVLVAAPGANVALQLVASSFYYTFGVAAYTAGGNITTNYGAGGAALTGLVSAANSVGAASSKALQFWPLSTVGVAIVSNAPLNLVSSVAFTQPGTATGTIAWEIWYRTMAVGF